MPEPTTPQLTESDVAELQARSLRSGYYDAAGFIPLTQFELDALIRDWRALRAERDEAIKSRDLFVSLKRGQTERANEIEARALELLSENAALREQLALEQETNKVFANVLAELQSRLVQVEKERERTQTQLSEATIAEIRALKGLRKQREVAAQFGTTQSHVSEIWSGRRR